MFDQDFLEVAQDTFGLDEREAGQLYDDLAYELEMDEITVLDLYDYGDIASDLVDVDDPYGVDYDEDWYDVGEEIEISFEVEYDAVPS